MSSSSGVGVGVDLEKFVIPLEEILLATQNFSSKSLISRNVNIVHHRGQLENHTVHIDRFRISDIIPIEFGNYFSDRFKIMSSFHHENIIRFIGYCHEGNERITVSEYAVNGRLGGYLLNDDKKRLLTWRHRLKICIGAAKGLEYLHSGLARKDNMVVIHRDVSSTSIVLDENLEAKICDFSRSLLIEGNQPEVYEPAPRTGCYLDPVYEESSCATTGLDIYSFGVVLFEMLSGMLARKKRRIDGNQPQALIELVRRHYNEGLYDLIDPNIRDQISMRSFKVFNETAYQCISHNLNDRPTMIIIVKRLQEALEFQQKGNHVYYLKFPDMDLWGRIMQFKARDGLINDGNTYTQYY